MAFCNFSFKLTNAFLQMIYEALFKACTDRVVFLSRHKPASLFAFGPAALFMNTFNHENLQKEVNENLYLQYGT
jgi:hypothetical protein